MQGSLVITFCKFLGECAGKKYGKSVCIWWSCDKNLVAYFFWLAVYMCVCVRVCSSIISWWHYVCIEFWISSTSDVSSSGHSLLSPSPWYFVYSLQGTVLWFFYATANRQCRKHYVFMSFVRACVRPSGGALQRRPHRRQELATLPSMRANPYSPPFPYVDLETRGFAVFLCFLVCILVKIDSR